MAFVDTKGAKAKPASSTNTAQGRPVPPGYGSWDQTALPGRPPLPPGWKPPDTGGWGAPPPGYNNPPGYINKNTDPATWGWGGPHEPDIFYGPSRGRYLETPTPTPAPATPEELAQQAADDVVAHQDAMNDDARYRAFAASHPKFAGAYDMSKSFEQRQKILTDLMAAQHEDAGRQRFINENHGTADVWNNRFNMAWPTPTSANGTRGPGAPTTSGVNSGSGLNWTQSTGGGGGGGTTMNVPSRLQTTNSYSPPASTGDGPGSGFIAYGDDNNLKGPAGAGNVSSYADMATGRVSAAPPPGGQDAMAALLRMMALQGAPMHNTVPPNAGGFASLNSALPNMMQQIQGTETPKDQPVQSGPPTTGDTRRGDNPGASQGWGLNSDNPQKQQFGAGGGTKDQWHQAIQNTGFAPGGIDSPAAANRFGQNPDGSWGSPGQATAQGMTFNARQNADAGYDFRAKINANRAAAGLPPI